MPPVVDRLEGRLMSGAWTPSSDAIQGATIATPCTAKSPVRVAPATRQDAL